MKRLAIKSQVLVLVLLVLFIAGGAWLAYWMARQSQVEVEAAFQRDLSVMTAASEARGRFVRLQQLTEQFLETRDPALLERRREVLDEVKSSIQEIAAFLSAVRQAEFSKELDKRYAAFLSHQSDWIGRAQEGVVTPAQAQAFSKERKPLDELAETMLGVKDAATADLQQSRHTIHRASRHAVLLLAGAGLLAGLLVVGFLTFYIVRPVVALERKARAWELGQSWGAAGFRKASPEVTRLAECMRDMTERLNTQHKKDLDVARLKGMLVSVVTHEFSNALAVIQDVADQMKEAGGAATQVQHDQLLRMLEANIRSLNAASTTLLNMAKGETGKFVVHPARAEFHVLLAETLHRLEVLSERKGIEVRLDLPDRVPVLADPSALTIVLNELVSNAIQFTPEKGKIAVGLEEAPDAPDKVRVFVQDSGPGLDEGQIALMLSPQSVDSGRGAGVGLNMVKGILEAHGSALEIRSEPDKGSRFMFLLPIWKDQVAA